MSKLSAAAVALMESLRPAKPPPDSFTVADYAAHHGLTENQSDHRLRAAPGLSSGVFLVAGRRTRHYWASVKGR